MFRYQNNNKMGGICKVQCDESQFGKKHKPTQSGRGKHYTSRWVFGLTATNSRDTIKMGRK